MQQDTGRCAGTFERGGQAINVNVILGMFIFLSALGVTVILSQSALQPQASFEEQVATGTLNAVDTLQTVAGWTVFTTPIVIRSPAAVDAFPVDITVPLPDDVVANSILLLDDGTELASQHSAANNTAVFVTDLDGSTVVDLVYEKDLAVDDRSYSTGLDREGDTIDNHDLAVTVDDNGFSAITYKDINFLNGSADLGTDTWTRTTVGPVRANVSYDDGSSWARLYDTTRLIPVEHRFTGTHTWNLDLTGNLSTMYSSALGGTRSLAGSGTIYENDTDLLDLYSVRGIAVIGDDLSVKVSKQAAASHIDVQVNLTSTAGGSTAWLLVHDGNYTRAQPYNTVFQSPPSIDPGLPVPHRGISRERAASLATTSYDDLQSQLELGDLDYNLSLDTVIEKGRPVPAGATVAAVTYPAAVLTRFGNATMHDLALRVWE